MSMWLISMSSGYMDTEQHYNLCICPTQEIAERAMSLLDEDYRIAKVKWEAAKARGTAYPTLSGEVIPTRVPSAPLWSSTVDDEFDLYVEELPVWDGEQKDPLN